MKRARQPLRQVFAAPACIAVASLAGLLCALTGDGLRDALSWAALGLPVATLPWAWARRRS
ncbi:hypothetical protein [Novosphingobium profundi]|uniref:hypothetical protein n=1 Tax=Novosphingobium profundi TaxID=1774954 RepID=UPI001CFF0F62|nr:hypothetical protein [Novosphingobium profundi]